MCKPLAFSWLIAVLLIGTTGSATAGECEQLRHLKGELSAKVFGVKSGELERAEGMASVGKIIQELRAAGDKNTCGSEISIENRDSFEIKYSNGTGDIFNLDGKRLISWVRYPKTGPSQITNL